MTMAIQGASRASFASHAGTQAVEALHGVRRREADVQSALGAVETRRPHARHALADALSEALAGWEPTNAGGEVGVASSGNRSAWQQAGNEFARELFAALRPVASEEGAPGRHGRGFAWGRTSVTELAQRLESVARQFGAATFAAEVDAASTADEVDLPAEGAPEVAVQAPVPPAAQPTGGAPSSLWSAFEVLRGLGGQGGTSDDAASTGGALAALLNRMAQALLADPAVAARPATGSLVDTTA